MPIVAHRVNTIQELEAISERFGVEIDVRYDTRTGKLYLSHDQLGPEQIEGATFLEDYLGHFKFKSSRVIVFNIKDTGTEQRCIELARQAGIPDSNYFLLDVEPPYLYRASLSGVRTIAARFSEYEPIEQAVHFVPNSSGKPYVSWLWIDSTTCLPVTTENKAIVEKFNTCLVCPERWGRPNDIDKFITDLKRLGVTLDLVMTSLSHAVRWEKSGVVAERVPCLR